MTNFASTEQDHHGYWRLRAEDGDVPMAGFDSEAQAASWGTLQGFEVRGFRNLHRFWTRRGWILVDAGPAVREILAEAAAAASMAEFSAAC